MKRLTVWLAIPLLLLGGTVATLAWLQNSARSTDLSLNLGLAAWELAEPVSVPALVASAVAVGFLLGALAFGPAALRAASRARRAERQLAVVGSTPSPGPYPRTGPTPGAPATGERLDDGWK